MEAAIEILGALRACEAIDFLVDSIEIESPLLVTDRRDPAEGYPSVQALISIGYPSVNSILARCAQEGDGKRIRLYALVLSGVLGKGAARAVVTSVLSQVADTNSRSRLTALLESLK